MTDRLPQRRRLFRVPDLAAFRAALVDLASEGDWVAVRRRAFVLPTRGAAELFRRTLEDGRLRAAGDALIVPDLVTRDDLVDRLHAAIAGAPRLASRLEREVLFERAAREAGAATPPPFRVRPGLVAAMLDFYDELRRRGRSVARFADAIGQELAGYEDAEDRGSAELIRQTAFLTRSFEAYEAALDAAGLLDEHGTRGRLLAAPASLPFDHLVAAVADHPADPRGLWPADFDLLGRLPTLHRLDVVVTDETHDAGFRERLERELPEIEEVRVGAASPPPTIVVRAAAGDEGICHSSRDREEELRDVARAIRAGSRVDVGDVGAGVSPPAGPGEAGPSVVPKTAIVFARPLPYVYLAQQVLGDARVPYQTFDALPLAAEPYAALVDLVLAFARSGGTRESAVALLRSPLLRFDTPDGHATLSDAAALDAILAEGRAAGEADTYLAFVERAADAREAAGARRAARAAAAIREALLPFRQAAAASVQLGALAGFLRAHERRVPFDAPWRERHLRARAALLGALGALEAAYRQHDDGRRDVGDLTATLHQWIERQTFAPRRGEAGVHLVDAVAARFGAFDDVHLVGLVDADWPERPTRNIFYTSGLLKSLGWPSETEHLRAEQAAFRDLVRLPRATLRLSAFQLEGDAVAAPSPLADEARHLPRMAAPSLDARLFSDERLGYEPVMAGGLAAVPREWLARRLARPLTTTPAYRGEVGAIAADTYRVSKVEAYVKCPFKYFAESVLKLGEEPDEEAGLSPRERGMLLHRLFERFYAAWDHEGRGAITAESLAEAVTRFEALAHEELARLPESDRVLESTRLLGSVVERGVAERVFQAEADAGRTVRRRLLEQPLNGSFALPTALGVPLAVAIRGKADRIDVLDDQSLRVIDYKLSAAPQHKGAVQLPVYAWCVQERLEAGDAAAHPVAEAYYVSFGDDWNVVTSLAKRGRVADAVRAGAQGFAAHVQAIEAGHFPPRPQQASYCSWCTYVHVCRKEIVDDDAGEERDATGSV